MVSLRHEDQDSARFLDQLTEINTQDLLKSFGLAGVRRFRHLIERVGRPAARRLAQQSLTFDSLVESVGLQAGGAWMLGQYVRQFVVIDGEHIPSQGPLLFVANHPGLYDTIALFAAISRPDLQVLAADRPFLRALPHVCNHLILLNEAANDRARVVRAATRHLRAGGAILTFPGGKIEPDPATMPGALDALQHWSESIRVFARLVPQVTVVPVIVSGVIARAALAHPLSRIRGPQHHDLLAATLQLLFPSVLHEAVTVRFGPAITTATNADLSAAVVAAAQQLILAASSAAPL